MNGYIVYEISFSTCRYDDYTVLRNSLLGAVQLVKSADIDKCKYSWYGILFDRRRSFSVPSGGFGQNVIILWVDISSFLHVDNKKKDILTLGEGHTQGLDGTTLTAEKKYSINFTKSRKKFCLSLHYIEGNSFLFVNDIEVHKLKAKDPEIVATPSCLEIKYCSVDNKKDMIKWIYLWF